MPADTKLILKGCDVSDWQSPSLVDWRSQDFGIVKATDGKRPMKKTLAHVAEIRGAASPIPHSPGFADVYTPRSCVLGLYHFLRADSPVQEQFEAFNKVAADASLLNGDLLPCIDIEDYPGYSLDRDPQGHSERAREFAMLCREAFGGAILYIKAHDWRRLGKPGWVLEYPLWVAHYPAEGSTRHLAAPAAIAGRSYRIWQRMVGPLGQVLQASKNPRAVDQNIATYPLPLIERGIVKSADDRIPWVLMTADTAEEMRQARDLHLRRELDDA